MNICSYFVQYGDMVLCMCLGMLYYGPRAGAGVAPPASAGNCWYNQHQLWPAATARPPGESLRGIFHPETEPSSGTAHGSTMGVLYGKKTFYTSTLSNHFYVIWTHSVEMRKWQCLLCKSWRCQFKMQNRLLSRLLFCARSTFWIEDYCAVTFNFAGIIAKKCCKGESFNLFQ